MDLSESLLTLRWLVMTLGQQGSAGWWPCSFLTATGERFLSTPFPRSAFWASFHATTIAAARHHDERIGGGGTVHLFRLGQEWELILRDKVLRHRWRPKSDLTADSSVLLAALSKWDEVPANSGVEGPIRVSDVPRFAQPKTIGKVAGLYAEAFAKTIQILPYGSEK